MLPVEEAEKLYKIILKRKGQKGSSSSPAKKSKAAPSKSSKSAPKPNKAKAPLDGSDIVADTGLALGTGEEAVGVGGF